MEKDYEPSEKYSQEEIDNLGIPYGLNDCCVDQLADYRSWVQISKWNFLPLFHRLGPCRQFYDRWIICQSNREFEIKEKQRSQVAIIEQAADRTKSRMSSLSD